MLIREITHKKCIAFIAEQRLARLACAKDNIPYIIPIYYAHEGNRLYVFSMPGKKLDFLRSNPHVCLQIDRYQDKHNWVSVVVDALFHELPDDEQDHAERLHAWSLLQRHFDWWEAGATLLGPHPVRESSPHVFFALDIIAVSGREASEGDPTVPSS
ncbi:pyridoxamine 5'-phosphate oxidase family protein [Rhizobium sp. S95]|uniref:Pyridoxamine 5'-phosphate oxidase family protein n=1 Tax=Ciceribacter sichuanensis TaxID=2949647 RepID=A0AAJ1FAC3_9HYPH|nr:MULTISPECIES: pyridoxamine 5'-phosphate oxidase family protein [unclassified Ciceribacter]MCM2396038.1 pyridoxamine 5'-phosphate oxidase family protein [Ciceribacter sp. S95]MCO5960158.1 pyridoxamine 5'-phosphate oxidase family protein [Ciceribacter sp. S101]